MGAQNKDLGGTRWQVPGGCGDPLSAGQRAFNRAPRPTARPDGEVVEDGTDGAIGVAQRHVDRPLAVAGRHRQTLAQPVGPDDETPEGGGQCDVVLVTFWLRSDDCLESGVEQAWVDGVRASSSHVEARDYGRPIAGETAYDPVGLAVVKAEGAEGGVHLVDR
jgi:hypothetical protein